MITDLTRRWKVHLVHHTHTDIGYTETQARIERYHIDFIDQVLDHHENGVKGSVPFKWTNECFWSIERWLAANKGEGRERLAEAVKGGTLGLTGTYLHFTELIDKDATRAALSRPAEFARSLGMEADTALAADINGFGWGYSQALYDAGVRNLVTCVHSVHGMAPIGKRQLPFYWETPKGQEILVWNGEHYLLGNVLGLVPNAIISYAFSDELKPTPASPWSSFYAEQRLPRYLKQLEEDDYPFDFVVVHGSGTISDNAPPCFEIPKFFSEWNSRHGDTISLQMAHVSEVPTLVRSSPHEIPRYRGDWPDWWSDGFAATPDETRFIREARRGLQRLRGLRKHFGASFSEETEQRVEQDIIMYTEHTFNHTDSMKMPWDGMGRVIGACKEALPSHAVSGVIDAEYDAFRSLGASAQTAAREHKYKVVNPFDHTINDVAKLFFEYSDFDVKDLSAVILDEYGKPVANVQRSPAPRGLHFMVPVVLQPGEARIFQIVEGRPTVSHRQRGLNDFDPRGWSDVEGFEGLPSYGYRVEDALHRVKTPFGEVSISDEDGIVAWHDEKGRDLLAAGRSYTPFSMIYERTPVTPTNDGDAQVRIRGTFGRNRKGKDVVRTASQLTNVCRLADNELFTEIRFDYELTGCSFLQSDMRIWKTQPKADFSLRMNKDSVWDPENLYLSLPFGPNSSDGGQLWLDKSGAEVRPVIDQLPDTLTDWYCIQAGYAICGDDFGIAISMPDSPLLQLGPLDFGPRRLAGFPGLNRESKDAFAWLMTNYWETNFEASLAGFHEFNFRLQWGGSLRDSGVALAVARQLECHLPTFRSL